MTPSEPSPPAAPVRNHSPAYAIRARFDAATVRVYQAFSAQIALPALKAGRFAAPFSLSRMTWIKPSFNWMMYRSGFATKSDQEYVLGIDIAREGFEWALEHAVLSSFHPGVHACVEEWRQLLQEKPVRIQWDPERDWRLRAIASRRTIQIGLSGEAVDDYVNEWIMRIENVTPLAHLFGSFAQSGTIPAERPDQDEAIYPLRPELAERLIPRS